MARKSIVYFRSGCAYIVRAHCTCISDTVVVATYFTRFASFLIAVDIYVSYTCNSKFTDFPKYYNVATGFYFARLVCARECGCGSVKIKQQIRSPELI